MQKPKITIITVNWWAGDFWKILVENIKKSKYFGEIELITINNSQENLAFQIGRSLTPKENLGHGGGLDLGIQEAQGEYILILDVDAHILLEDWDEKLIKAFEDNQDLRLACASDSGLLKPARPLAMFFRREDFVKNNMSMKAVELGGVKFDVGVHFYFRILTLFGDKAVKKLTYAETKYKDVLGNEYLLDGERFVYHNWYGTRWYNARGERVHNQIDRVKWGDFSIKKDNLFKQIQ